MSSRPFDLVIYGATGFAGAQAVRYLSEHCPPDLRWAIAGRSRDKLSAVARRFGRGELPLILADASDPGSVRQMTEQTQAIVSTVGPFVRYGTPLIEACLASRTHYADITGETAWVRTIIDRFEAAAKDQGVRLVPFSGYDSVPSDAGAHALISHLRTSRGVGVRRLEAFHSARGGFNGGTLATMLEMAKGGDAAMREPWLLSPGFRPSDAARIFDRDPERVHFHERAGLWTAPFVMSVINTRVVRRSAALFAAKGAPYGADFAFQEYFASRSRVSAWAVAAGAGTLNAAVQTGTGRAIIAALGPKPGEGPSERSIDEGFFRCRYVAEAEDGSVASAVMKGQGDPGNRSTVRFLVESGILLSQSSADAEGGVLTPAIAFGGQLIERCKPHGLSFEIEG